MIALHSIAKPLSKNLRMHILKIPLPKAYEMSTGSQSFNIDSLTFDKSEKRDNIYDSYNTEKKRDIYQICCFRIHFRNIQTEKPKEV